MNRQANIIVILMGIEKYSFCRVVGEGRVAHILIWVNLIGLNDLPQQQQKRGKDYHYFAKMFELQLRSVVY